MRVTMVGTGYVGLVSGACFADFGHQVICVDKDAGKIDRLHQGIMPIFEPGLVDLVESNVKAGRLSFTTDLSDAVKEADTVFIAVGTPSRRGDGHADLSYVEQAARETNASILDLRDWFCRNDLCTTTKDGMWLYRDAAHLSVEASESLVPEFKKILEGIRNQ